MISFNGVSQYASAGKNLNVEQATDFNKSWSLTFFIQANTLKTCDVFGTSQIYTGNTWKGILIILSSTGQLVITHGDRTASDPFTERIQVNSVGSLKQSRFYFVSYTYLYPNTSHLHINAIKENVTSPIYAVPTKSYYYDPNQELSLGRASTDTTRSFSGFLAYPTFYNRQLNEKEIIYEHQNAKPHPDTYLNVVARYEPGANGHTILDKVQDYNPALTPYNASLINYADAEVGIPDQSTNTAYKDFHTKQNIVTL